MIRTLIVIPVRMKSTRLPGKPLIKIRGKTMIERVWHNAKKADVGDVYVACCEKEIEEVLKKKKISYIFTKKNAKSGTDRVYDAFSKIKNKSKYNVVINLQGDLPYFNPLYLKKLLALTTVNNFQIGTLVNPIINKKKISDNNIVKVAISNYKKNVYKAIYFSRLPIPYNADKFYEHIGVYAYKPSILKKFVEFKQTKLEKFESLEQLRALENQINIFASSVSKAPISIDTKNDLKNLLK